VKLEERYRVVAFADADDVGERDVIDLWERHNVVSGAKAVERARQVARVVVDAEDGLVGVSTVYLAPSSQLRTPMWHFRTFVASAHRHADLARHLLHLTTMDLEDAFTSGRDTRAPGMVMHIQNEGIKRYWNQGLWIHPVWPGAQWPFIGDNKRGDHVRVHWFRGARAPLA
jgi:hypothetical protein